MRARVEPARRAGGIMSSSPPAAVRAGRAASHCLAATAGCTRAGARATCGSHGGPRMRRRTHARVMYVMVQMHGRQRKRQKPPGGRPEQRLQGRCTSRCLAPAALSHARQRQLARTDESIDRQARPSADRRFRIASRRKRCATSEPARCCWLLRLRLVAWRACRRHIFVAASTPLRSLQRRASYSPR